MTAPDIRAALHERLSAPRAAHSERVAEAAAHLAACHGLDAEAARLAGWLHDWYKEVPVGEIVALARSCGVLGDAVPAEEVVPSVLHGPVAARLLPQRWPDLSPAVLDAVDRHTTGDPAMTAFDCCLYVGDMIEAGHDWPGVEELRGLAVRDLWAATLSGMETGLRHLLERGRAVDLRTVAARNAVLRRVRGSGGAGAPG